MLFTRKAVDRQNGWLRDLCAYEDVALDMLKPIDLRTMEPTIVEARPGTHRRLYDYWRVVISSKPQFTKPGVFRRQLQAFVMDRRTHGLLGVISLTDLPMDQNRSWIVACLGPHQGRYGSVLVLRRCLPIFEFGELRGGKLLYMLASSRENITALEMEFSQPWGTLIVPTEEHQASQFNRLQDAGLTMAWQSDEKSIYRQELRKHHTRFLQGEDRRWYDGGRKTISMERGLAHWRERWLEPRLRTIDSQSLIVPDPDRYRLTNLMNAKKMRFALEANDEAHREEDPRPKASPAADRRA